MTWQQIAVIVLWALGGAINLLKHGEYTKFNFWIWLLFSFPLSATILITGGFFNAR